MRGDAVGVFAVAVGEFAAAVGEFAVAEFANEFGAEVVEAAAAAAAARSP